jgi:hypothetical protein
MKRSGSSSRSWFRASVGLIMILESGLALTAQKPAWKGTISTENGIVVVKNPKNPTYEEGAFSFVHDLSIGMPGGPAGQAKAPFSRLWYLAVDDEENIYAMDQGDSQVKVFDAKGFFKRAIGRKGQGPGEFLHPNNIFLTSRRELVVEDYIRNLTYFTADGRHLRSLSTVRIFPVGVQVHADGRILALRNIPDPEKAGREIDLYDPELGFLKTLAAFPQQKPDPTLIEPFRPDVRWALSKNGTLIVSSGEEYDIDVFDLDGRLIRKIVRDYDLVRITDEDIKSRVPKVPEGRKVVAPKYFPAIRSLMMDEEGRILAGTYDKRAEGSFVYDIFDPAGKYVAKAAIKGKLQVWTKNRLYAVDEDEEGLQFISRYREAGRI